MTISTAYSARNESIKLSILLTCLCVVIIYGDWAWRIDRLFYDAQSRLISHTASDEIVIVAIDEKSLGSMGRWPWPRETHAKLIDKLTQHQAKAVLIDVIFSETSPDPKSDLELARAIQQNGKVILPVLLEQTRLRGHLIETLPIPLLAQAAAGLGHVHIEIDPDGIARGTFLYEGLGEAHWPHIGLAVLDMLNENDKISMESRNANRNTFNSPWTWVRQQHFLIPFIGPPGSFKTTSYINILNDEILSESLKDKIVLIGVTAAGLGDSLPTPVSGLARAMPGIEINANIIQAIKSNTLVTTITPGLYYFIAVILVMLPILLFPYLTPRLALALVIGEISFILLSTLILLEWSHIWIPSSAVILSLMLAYPLWAWRRLEFTVKYLNNELETLSNEATEIERYVSQDDKQSFETLENLLPVTGVNVFTKHNKAVLRQGAYCEISSNKNVDNDWSKISDSAYACNIAIDNDTFIICIQWKAENQPDEHQTKILKTYIRQQIKPQNTGAKSTVEIIESRIREIQTTTDKLTYLRQFITDSLEQMADGVIVINSLGIITLANHQAVRLIGSSDARPLLQQPIQPIIDTLTLSTTESWESIIDDLLTHKHYENLQVRTQKKKDLIINISPLYKHTGSIIGFIINLSDITEIKDAQRRRNEMLSFLSHDLRSPLVSILAILEQEKSADNENPLNLRIEKNINQTIELAEDFVHLSRVESNDDISFTQINMADVIANAIDTVWDQARIKNIKLEDSSNIDGWVSGNGAILERVIINLLTNAIKYGHDDSNVSVSLDQRNSSIVCCITDNGPGIDEKDIPYLFDRFRRLQQTEVVKSGITQGIGLGLAFVHAAIERHHGAIEVTSTPGSGTEFCITLPAIV